MNENPFLNSNFIKDIKRCFVPTKIFIKNKYNYNIKNVEFKLKKDNIVNIIIKLENGNKYSHVYIINKDKSLDSMDIDKVTDDISKMNLNKD